MEEGFTHRTPARLCCGHGGERRLLTDFMSERVTVCWRCERFFSDRETKGRVTTVQVVGLKITDMSRLPHWADPNVENKGEKVYRTIPGTCGFLLLLFVCRHTQIHTLSFQSQTSVNVGIERHCKLQVRAGCRTLHILFVLFSTDHMPKSISRLSHSVLHGVPL